jgi:cytochrome c-type biogenesis protein CcmH/NrfG
VATNNIYVGNSTIYIEPGVGAFSVIAETLDPFEDLGKLLGFHFGRIRLNQSIFQLKTGNREKGIALLAQATTMQEGWKGMQAKIAMANILADRKLMAVEILKDVNKEYLPAFYCLKEDMHIDTTGFDSKDWNSAVEMLIQLQQNKEAVAVAKRVTVKYPQDANSWNLLGKAWKETGAKEASKACFERAVKLDGHVSAAKELKGQARE